ncbi:DUF3159 domain-containing protein [Arthrobacter sp. Sr33]|uniref:DUF3159 domain-containing protein n=1 Tax=Arthrobacter sp. TB 23 TaxID=494419 RepID=UPI0002F7BF0B|nr:DUF3159 domain-containing protein [Arthrobacter sp. TB 23]
MSTTPPPSTPSGDNPAPRQGPTAAELAGQYAARSGVQRSDDGQIDVLQSIGGVRGLAESILPGLIFTVMFTINQDLQVSLIAAIGVAAIFSIIRLVSRTPLTQALSGLIGVAICAFVAGRTGNAEDFFVPGFFTNGGYIIAMVISIAVRWPIAGLLFGFIRGEGVEWRKDPKRVRAYTIATWIIVTVLGLRLAVQMPLYFAENFVALGTTRLIMGLPLYALGLWLAWLVSRPTAQPQESSEPRERS